MSSGLDAALKGGVIGALYLVSQPAQPGSPMLFLWGFIHLFKLDPSSPRISRGRNGRASSGQTRHHGDAHRSPPIPEKPPGLSSNRSEAGTRGGGSRAAPKRDIEIVEERRLVGNECHSLRVLIIWRGVCSARPVRLPGRNPGGAETKLNWDDW